MILGDIIPWYFYVIQKTLDIQLKSVPSKNRYYFQKKIIPTKTSEVAIILENMLLGLASY